jgi:hypothetical protein
VGQDAKNVETVSGCALFQRKRFLGEENLKKESRNFCGLVKKVFLCGFFDN